MKTSYVLNTALDTRGNVVEKRQNALSLCNLDFSGGDTERGTENIFQMVIRAARRITEKGESAL